MKIEQDKKDWPRLLNVKKASLYSGLPIWAIRQLIWGGKIPTVRTGRTYYISVEDMERWINDNKTYQV